MPEQEDKNKTARASSRSKIVGLHSIECLNSLEMSSSWNFLARASSSYEGSKPSQAGALNFRAETELTIEAIFKP